MLFGKQFYLWCSPEFLLLHILLLKVWSQGRDVKQACRPTIAIPFECVCLHQWTRVCVCVWVWVWNKSASFPKLLKVKVFSRFLVSDS